MGLSDKKWYLLGNYRVFLNKLPSFPIELLVIGTYLFFNFVLLLNWYYLKFDFSFVKLLYSCQKKRKNLIFFPEYSYL